MLSFFGSVKPIAMLHFFDFRLHNVKSGKPPSFGMREIKRFFAVASRPRPFHLGWRKGRHGGSHD
jgi:hypothetical protein